ncbi:MAG: Rrf2 family transcriptional regulator [Planctomycetia bacterium]|nr:Rrf2 family transcriptional regulator [Planctomycetia bacterium]
MRLALHTDYALRTLIYLAGRPGRARIGDVARFFRISVHHVAKVVNNLARLGYVRSVRGVRGGIELGKPAATIRLGDVILASEGNMHLLECVGTEGVCVIQPSCKLRGILAEAENVQLAFLNRYTLDQIVRPGGQLTELRVVSAK